MLKDLNPTPYRGYCYACWQAEDLCLCPHIKPETSALDVIILQHPRERRMTINTGRIVNLGLKNASIHYGVNFDKESHFKDIVAKEPEGSIGILFPSNEATPIEDAPKDLKKIILVDGTWSEAKKMLHRSSCLHSIPKYSISPQEESNYRIRKEPAPHCLSTVEATVALLRDFSKDGEAHQHLIDSFQLMVRQQEGYIHKNSRHQTNRRKLVKIKERARLKKILFSTLPTLRLEHLNALPADEQERISFIAKELWAIDDVFTTESIRPIEKNEFEKTDEVFQ